MEEKIAEEKGQQLKSSFWSILRECAVPLAAFLLFLGALCVGLFFSIPDVLPLAALLALPMLIATTNLNGLFCFVLVSSFFLLTLALSGIELWRMTVLFLTFVLPALVLMFYRSYPGRVGRMITAFCEESTKLDSMPGVCALAVRMLKGSGFFRHIALLQWNRETDKFKIVAATSAYEVGTEISSDSTFYIKCHATLKLDRFRDPYSNIYFLPSKFKARSAICAPLHLGGRRFGVIVVESHFSRAWSPGTRQILQFFAVVLSYVIAEFEMRDGMKRGVTGSMKRGAFPAGKST